MNRLRIVVEETEPGVYEVKYAGRDATKAQAALHEPTTKRRALYVYPHPSQYNRRLLEDSLKPNAGGTPATEVPVEGAGESPAIELPIDQEASVDEAADLVGGATESPATETPGGKAKAKAAPKAKAKQGK